SGTLLAINLAKFANLAQSQVEITVYEPRQQLGEGVAYSTTDAQHLLNVPAIGMSAFVELPTHFRDWAGADDGDFVERRRYGAYLRETLANTLRENKFATVRHSQHLVTDINPKNRIALTLQENSVAMHDAVVVATGNSAPVCPSFIKPHDRVIVDPWAPNALSIIKSGERVACIGTGLTFVDVALSLVACGATVSAFSRHGLLPREHAKMSELPKPPKTFANSRSALRWLREQSDWRAAVNSLRPMTQSLWQSFDDGERRRFLRHAMRFWEIHRHRMAPRVAEQLNLLIAKGSVIVAAMRVASVRETSDTRLQLVDNLGLRPKPSTASFFAPALATMRRQVKTCSQRFWPKVCFSADN
ncbi:MAG: hypothetical protein EBV58_08555, partial [Actinobacteria bacterium]|nr:hypothetical protein [Actinomycetota bacterium]